MYRQKYLAIEAPPPPTPPTTPTTPARTDDTKTSSDTDEPVEVDHELMRLYKTAFRHLLSKSQNNRQLGVGFQNMGNTCFMNTTLQAIINTPKIRQCFTRDAFMKHVNEDNKLGTKGTISSVFSALVDLYFSGDATVVLPEIFLDTFTDKVNRSFADGRQHDAQEFQTYLMDALHEDTNRVKDRKPFEQNYDGTDMAMHAEDYNSKLSQFASSPIADLFNLRTVSVVTCSECETSSATFEDQAQISLELEDNHYNGNNNILRLHDCLRSHFKEESLQDDSQWNCPSCKEPKDATRVTKIWRMPKTLIIHFKRFAEAYGGYVKNRTNVHFDVETLKMDEYLHEDAPRQNSCFALYAITNHFGTLNSGHYTSYVKGKNGWLNFDDEYVSEVSREALQSSEALVLFYTARPQL